MGLLPLEFSDCLLDSPYFRENLKNHERKLEEASDSIKTISKAIEDVTQASRTLSKCKRQLASSLDAFQFDCPGSSLSGDEVVISNSLRQFALLLNAVEDETNRILDRAQEKFVVPLEGFRKEQIGSVRKVKKEFEKATKALCSAERQYVSIGAKRPDSLSDAAEDVRAEKKRLRECSLEYIYLMHVVQEKKKFEFVESILSFLTAWTMFSRHSHSVTADFDDFFVDLQKRVQKTRENFSETVDRFDSLKNKTRRNADCVDAGLINKMYTRQGYLYGHLNSTKRTNHLKLGSQWTKYYCQYQVCSTFLAGRRFRLVYTLYT